MGNYQAYEKYKDSGVEWLGAIPEHWEAKRLKFVANVQPSNVDKKTNDDESSVLLCNYSDVYNNELITDKIEFMQATATQAEIKKFSINKGDVIITKDSESPHDIAVPALVSQDFNSVLCGYHLTQIKQKDLDGKFLFRLFQCKQFNAQFIVSANGVTRFGLPQKAINDAFVTFPPLDEQESIANFLDRKTKQIDDLIAKKEALLAKLDEKRSSIISHAVTKGLDHNVPMKNSGIEWLGTIPKHWKVKRLRFVGSCQNGVSKGGEYFGSGYPFVNYTDVYNNLELPKTVSGLAESTDADRINYSVQTGDIFFTRTSETVEEIGITSTCLETVNNAIFSGFLIRFRPFNNLLFQEFSKYYFRCQLHRLFFVKEMNLVTRASLSQELLKRLPVLLPPIKEQEIISKYLDKKIAEIDLQKAKVQEAIERLKEYRTALITNAVTGKIDVRQVSLN